MTPLSKFIKSISDNGYDKELKLTELLSYITHAPFDNDWLNAYIQLIDQFLKLKDDRICSMNKEGVVIIQDISFSRFKTIVNKKKPNKLKTITKKLNKSIKK